VPLSLVPRSDARAIAMRPSSRDGLGALAAAWRATQQPTTVRTFARVAATTPPADTSTPDASTSETGDEPPYWPDGPSAA
jgi:hypothetical protein